MSPTDDGHRRETVIRSIAETRRALAEVDARRLEFEAALARMEAELSVAASASISIAHT